MRFAHKTDEGNIGRVGAVGLPTILTGKQPEPLEMFF